MTVLFSAQPHLVHPWDNSHGPQDLSYLHQAHRYDCSSTLSRSIRSGNQPHPQGFVGPQSHLARLRFGMLIRPLENLQESLVGQRVSEVNRLRANEPAKNQDLTISISCYILLHRVDVRIQFLASPLLMACRIP